MGENETRKGSIEHIAGPWQRFGRAGSHVGFGNAPTALGDELLSRIDRRDPLGAGPSSELGCQRTGTAADVENAKPRTDPRCVGELRGQRLRVPPHESVVVIRR